MRCPHCGTRETRVVDSRDLDEAADDPPSPRVPGLHDPVHDLRARRGRPAGRRQARRHPPGVRPRQARRRPGKALTRRPVPTTPRTARPTRSRRSCARPVSPRSPARASGAGDGQAAAPSTRSRTSGSHRLPELRGPRGPQARGRHPDAETGSTSTPGGGQGAAEVSVLADRDIRAELESRAGPHRPVRPGGPPAVVGRPPPRPLVPGLPQQPLPVHRRPRAAARPDRAAEGRGRRAVHPPPRRVRARPDPRVGRAARRPRGRLEGRSRWAARPAHPLDRRVRRPGLEGQPDARAVERREPADRALLRDEDRPDQLLPDELGGRSGRTAPELGSKYQGQSEPTASASRTPISRTRPREGRCGTLNESVDWRARPRRRVPRRAGPGRDVPVRTPGRCSGRCRTCSWKAVGR